MSLLLDSGTARASLTMPRWILSRIPSMIPVMNAPAGRVVALHLGKVREIASAESGEWWDRSWQTGFLKTPQDQPCWLGEVGFRGDEQADRVHHGGPDKAVCVYSREHYPYWRETLALPELPHGAFGENLTLEGFLETGVCVGDRFSLGEAQVQVTQPRQPCWKLARRWKVKDLAVQVERTGYTGFYFRVERQGEVRPGESLTLLERPFPEWTIERCNQIMHHSRTDIDAARALSECRDLSASWKSTLAGRAEKKAGPSPKLRTDQPE